MTSIFDKSNWQRMCIVLSAIVLFTQCQPTEKMEDHAWPEVKSVYRPGTYWWWMGSAVDKKNLSYNLKSFADVGIGNVQIVPIYGVDGEEDKYIDFLSPKWMEMLSYTVEEANKLNINVDLSTTTGWPFGGSHVTAAYAASKLKFEKVVIFSKNKFQKQIDTTNLIAIIAQSENKSGIDISNKIDKEGLLNWVVPEGKWDVYIVHKTGTNQQVKRAAPGNEGLVLNPFSTEGLEFYLGRYDSAFSNYRDINLRAKYHDSYEYYRANWTSEFFDEFQAINGYDLKNYMPQVLDTLKMDKRITADFRRTLASLHLKYIEYWTNWSNQKGWVTRNQAHGAPGNLLDLYAAADIPETEMFGSRKYKMPGIKYDVNYNEKMGSPNPLVVKFASSAAHVSGKSLITSETATWLRNHYNASLSQVKPEIDELFYSGVNHIFYHGNAYSPEEASWPGWNFYASTHFEKENAIWHDISELNAYITRCQSILQSGKPASDILLYWPVEDIYHDFPDPVRFYKSMGVHNIDWFENSDFGKLATVLESEGYSFDYISDKQLDGLQVKNEGLITNGNIYKIILVPLTKHMSIKTWNRINQLASDGANVIFHQRLPLDVPGYNNFDQRREELRRSESALKFEPNKKNGLSEAKIGRGKVIVSDRVDIALQESGIQKEQIVQDEVYFIKRTHEKGFYYFLTNFSDKKLDKWVPLTKKFESAIILDPRVQNRVGVASTRMKNGNSEIYLQIQPGESFFVKTFTDTKIDGEKWNYLLTENVPIPLNGIWHVDFIEGAPKLPGSFITTELKSWTILGNSDAESFAGTGRYTQKFLLPDTVADDWKLDLGNVCESARIIINGEYVGTLWSAPFNILIGKYLKPGKNILEIEVTNLSANRLRDLEIRGVDWKKFLFVDIFYKKFDASQWPLMDSGLLGPVTLTPLRIKSFENN